MLTIVNLRLAMAVGMCVVAGHAEVCDVQVPQAVSPRGKLRLIWSDEFTGNRMDPAKWNHDLGGSGWGNNELQTYTSRAENLLLRGGRLVIAARRENFIDGDGVTREFTSARINTQDKFHVRYGRIEARIQLPKGKGLWPAFWLISVDKRDAQDRPCGEIDIVENVGSEPHVVHGTLHVPENKRAVEFKLPKKKQFAKDFHIFGIDWDPSSIRFFVDHKLYRVVAREELAPWVFDRDFYLVLNLAVGGDWPGPPDESTRFPQTLQVDWVRVWTK
jgi:beta-glucanase (GH16 family)